MAQGTQFDTFSYVYDGFDQLLNDYVLDSAEKLSTAIAPTAYAMLAIYFVLWGFSMIRNIIEEPVTDGLFRMLKVSLILGFALNSGRYAGDITGFFMQTPEAMAQVVVLDSSTDGASIGSTADALVQRTIDSGTKIWDQAGVMNGNVGHYFVAILVMAFGFVLSAVAFMIFMFAKFGLVFLLALGPIFILMLMFGPTRALFEGWLRQLVTLALTMVFILAAATFIFSMVEAVAERADASWLPISCSRGWSSWGRRRWRARCCCSTSRAWRVRSRAVCRWRWGRPCAGCRALAGPSVSRLRGRRLLRPAEPPSVSVPLRRPRG